MTSIAVVMVVRDDLPFVREAVQAALEYADEFSIIDNGSTDGTWEWLNDAFRPSLSMTRLTLDRWPASAIYEHGFSFLKNIATQAAQAEWIHSLDSDEMLSAEQREELPVFLEHCDKPIVSVNTFTFNRPEGLDLVPMGEPRVSEDMIESLQLVHPTQWNWIANNLPWDECAHRRIFRNGIGIDWKGYIHEELYQGETNGMGICAPSSFKHLHFSNFRSWGDEEIKQGRYSAMLLQAHFNKDLQRYTNSWWYDTWTVEKLDELKEMAKPYLEAQAAWDPEVLPDAE